MFFCTYEIKSSFTLSSSSFSLSASSSDLLTSTIFSEFTSIIETRSPSSNSFNDLIGVRVECPYRGALKNFAIKANSTFVWYDFSCYSSLTSANEFEESFFKDIINGTYYIYNFIKCFNITFIGLLFILFYPLQYCYNLCFPHISF